MKFPRLCSDCAPASHPATRRDFLRTGAVALAAGALGSGSGSLLKAASPTRTAASLPTEEALVQKFHQSLSEEQRRMFCLPFDHPRRLDVDNAWHITKARVGQDLTRDQQEMVREIFLGLHHPDYAATILKATEHDLGDKGLGAASVAVFGEPGTGKFEFVLSGRHVTRRCDGDSVEGAAFGGPIFYGHAPLEDDEAPGHPQNVYWYQAQRANEVYQMLDGRQRALALVPEHRKEQGRDTVKLSGRKTGLPGIPWGELTHDQRELTRKVMTDLLAPFRARDAAETLKLVEAAGLEHLHLAFFKSDDLGNDGVWDVWQIEGPSAVWYFRGAPHVHAWVHVRDRATPA